MISRQADKAISCPGLTSHLLFGTSMGPKLSLSMRLSVTETSISLLMSLALLLEDVLLQSLASTLLLYVALTQTFAEISKLTRRALVGMAFVDMQLETLSIEIRSLLSVRRRIIRRQDCRMMASKYRSVLLTNNPEYILCDPEWFESSPKLEDRENIHWVKRRLLAGRDAATRTHGGTTNSFMVGRHRFNATLDLMPSVHFFKDIVNSSKVL